MSITITPTLTIAGTTVAGDLAGDPQLVAVDDLRMVWGRSGVLDRPTPATVQVTLLDRSRRAVWARRTDLIGQQVVIGWLAPGGASGVLFRGRITDSAATPRPHAVVGGGFLLSLSASSVEVELANYTAPAGTVFPAETFGARAARIRTLLPAGMLAGGVNLPAVADLGLDPAVLPVSGTLDSFPAAQVDVSGSSALDLFRGLFDSASPQPMIYRPDTDELNVAPRRRYAYAFGMTLAAQLRSSPDASGRYVGASTAGNHLDAHLLGYSGALQQPLESRITRVEVGFLDLAAGYAQRTATAATAATADEPTIGRRVLSVSSVHSQVTLATQLATLYADVVNREARTPRLGQLSWTSKREPIPDLTHAQLLLSGSETPAAVFLGRSWVTQLGARPLVGLLGATTVYSGGEWSVTFTPGPVVVDPGSTHTAAPITVAASAKTNAVHLSHIDRSVTFGDVGYVEVGAGFSLLDVQPYKGNPT